MTFTATTSGTGPFTYQWYVNGNLIAGATSSTYTITSTTSGMNGNQYTVVVTNPGGSTSLGYTLTVNTPPSVSTAPVAQTVTAGQTASFSIAAAGTAPFTYQWYVNGAPIAGATSSSYTTPQTASLGTFAYTCAITNVAGTITSSPAVLTVNPIVPVLNFAAIATHTYGDAPFSVSASSVSSGAVTYSVVSGPATVSGSMVAITGTGKVVLQATQTASNLYAGATSTTSFTVNTEVPALTFAPVAAHTYGDAPFQVAASSASGGAVTYSVVSGPATVSGSTVTLTGAGTVQLQAAQAANGNYAATTAATSFTVNVETPALAFSPVAAHTYGDAPFPVAASSASSGAVSYSVVSGPATVSGSTVTITGAGTVQLQATQAANGNYATATANTSFTVNPATPTLAFTAVPTHTYGDAPFSVAASSASNGAVTYSVVSGPATISGSMVTLTGIGTVQLQASQVAAGNYTAATGNTSFTVNAETPTLAFAAIPAHTYGDAAFPVSATSASSGAVTYSVVSGPATVSGSTVTLTGIGTVQLQASQVAAGNYAVATTTASFTVNAETPTLAFAAVPVHTYGDAPFPVSATSASSGAVTYSVVSGPATVSGSTVTLTGAGTVQLKAAQAANGNYAAATTTTIVTVNPATPTLAFTTVPTHTYGDAPFSVSASSVSNGAVTYSVASGPATISGSMVTLTGVGTVQLQATQAATGNYNSASANTSFAVNDSTPVATSLTGSTATPAYDASIILTPVFSGGTAMIGTGGINSHDVTANAVSGQNYTSATLSGRTTYTLTVVSLGGSSTVSTTFVATPQTVALTPITPSNQTMAPGPISFSTSASGGPTNTVTWSTSGGSISGSGVWTAPDTPGAYTITATSVDDPTKQVSTTATISAPVITTQPVSKNVCTGYAATLSLAANYADNYIWMKGGNVVATTNTPALSFASADSSNNGTYTCIVTNDAGNITSSSAIVNVMTKTTLSITNQPANVSVYATQTATFSAGATGTGTLSYQWYKNSSAISGATSSSYTTGALTSANNGDTYYVTVTDGDCTNSTVTSNTATLSVSSTDTTVPPTIVVQPQGVAAASGGSATFSVTASCSGTLYYQWYQVPYTSSSMATVAGTEISGATSSTYTVPSGNLNDGDQYYVIVHSNYGTAVSQRAVLAVGSGILLQVTGQPVTKYIAANSLATYTVTATCTECTPTYKWYLFTPKGTTATVLSDETISSGNGLDSYLDGAVISGSSTGTLTLSNVPSSASGAVIYAVVTATSNGTNQAAGTNPITTNNAGLFVGSLGTIGVSGAGNGLCNQSSPSVVWALNGSSPGSGTVDSTSTSSSSGVPYQNTQSCTIELTNGGTSEQASVFWPTLISTAKFSVSFTVAMSNTGNPGDGFTMILADPSQGALTTSEGREGEGLGAARIPGLVLGFDTYQNGNNDNYSQSCNDSSNIDNGACDPTAVTYMAVGPGAAALWENPWTNVNGYLDTQSSAAYSSGTFANATHSYVVTVASGVMTVTMDGYELFTGPVTLPPAAYLGFTASTGSATEKVVISNMTATVSAP